MEEKINRIKNMYNDCAKSFNTYTKDHDLAEFQVRSTEIVKKYDCKTDIGDLMFWWYQMTQAVHDLYDKEVKNGERNSK